MWSPDISSTSFHPRGPRPLSITCVRPWWPFRFRSKAGNELLEFRLGAGLYVVVERVAVRVDADRQRAEVLDAELPEALGHELFPHHVLDLFELRRRERSRSADDREVDHAELLHRCDGLVGKAALAADRAHAVLTAERFREA